MSLRHVIDSLVHGSLIILWAWFKCLEVGSSCEDRELLGGGGGRGLVGGWVGHGLWLLFLVFKFLWFQRKKILECHLLKILLEVLILEVMGVDAAAGIGSRYYGIHRRFSLVLQVPSHDVITKIYSNKWVEFKWMGRILRYHGCETPACH